MTIHATTVADFATSLSRRVHRKLGEVESRPKLSAVRDSVASALGHRNWHALSRSGDAAPPTDGYAAIAGAVATRLATGGVTPAAARAACHGALGLGHPAGPPRAAGARAASLPAAAPQRRCRLDAMLDSVAITARRVADVGGAGLARLVAFGASTIAIGMSDEDDDLDEAYERLLPALSAKADDVVSLITDGTEPDPRDDADPRICLGMSAGPLRAAERRALAEFMATVRHQVETMCAKAGRDVDEVSGMAPFAMAQGAATLCLSAKWYPLGIALAEYALEAATGDWRRGVDAAPRSRRGASTRGDSRRPAGRTRRAEGPNPVGEA